MLNTKTKNVGHCVARIEPTTYAAGLFQYISKADGDIGLAVTPYCSCSI